MKTLADILLAFIGLLILSPVLLLVMILIFLFDFHNPFFTQERIGQNKKLFRIIKFRSMLNGEVTKFGRIMRRTGIDELPQLLNILMGQMSFVGPRPLTLADIERLEWNTAYYDQRWNLKPGIVGLAQLSPICHKKMSWFLDRYYIQKQNFILDVKILTSSALIPFVGKAQMKKWMHNK